MAAISGTFLSASEVVFGFANGSLSSELNEFTAVIYDPKLYDYEQHIFGVTDKSKISVTGGRWQINGVIQQSYFDDFYNRIHLTPNELNLENISSSQTRNVEFWNAYLVEKTVVSIVETNTDNISLTGIQETDVLKPLFNTIITIETSTEGSSIIDASYSFLLNGIDPVLLHITGRRIISFNYPYQSPFVEELSWLTNVLVSNNGTEQRIRLRKHPRAFIKANYPISYKNIQKVDNNLFGWLSKQWACPIWSESQLVGSLNGSNIINIPTSYVDIRVGGLVYIYDSNDVNETAEVESIYPSYITLKQPLINTYNSAYVMPCRVGTIVGSPNKEFKGLDFILTLSFEFSDNLSLGNGSTPTQFENEDLYVERTLMGEQFEDNYTTRVDIVDYETGAVNRFSPWQNIKKKRTLKYIIQGLEEISIFKKWLHRRAGRHRPFWIPSFEDDVFVTQTTLIVDSVIIKDNDYFAFSKNRQHIIIFLKNGNTVPVKILSAVKINEAETQLILNSTINIEPLDIVSISYLSLRRFDTDKVSINWLSNRTIVADIPVIEVKQ